MVKFFGAFWPNETLALLSLYAAAVDDKAEEHSKVMCTLCA